MVCPKVVCEVLVSACICCYFVACDLVLLITGAIGFLRC